MGEKLKKAFKIASDRGGRQAELRLAMKAGMPAAKAAGEADTPQLVEKFEKALKEIINEPVKL